MNQVIHLHVDAPAKPRAGDACNGCGLCCASEPCPLGVLASRRTTGACAALEWSDDEKRYRCGLIAHPAAHLPRAARALAPVVARFARRSVAAGLGCDCDLEPD